MSSPKNNGKISGIHVTRFVTVSLGELSPEAEMSMFVIGSLHESKDHNLRCRT